MARSESHPRPADADPASAVVGREGRCTIVRLAGEHDIATVPMITKALGRAARVGTDDVVVDLSDVRFLSAATLGAILRVRRILRAQGRELALRSPSSDARRLLDLCLLNVAVQTPPAQLSALAIDVVARRDGRPVPHDGAVVRRSHAST